MDLEKNVINLEESKRFELEKLENQCEKQRSAYSKDKEKTKEELKYLESQLESKNEKIQKMKFMIEDYELKVSSIEEQYKILLKTERDENKKKYQLVSNQLKCLESALRIEEMTKLELEKENKTLKNKLKEKESEILLIFQEINILKSEVISKDELKVKYAETTRAKGMGDLSILDLTDKNKRLKSR